MKYFFFGWLGVDLFFVLSGFLITDILLNTVNHPNYLRNFYMKRVLRIFPLYFLSLFLILIILPLIPNFPLDLGYYIQHQAWFWTYLQNWFLIFYDPGSTTTIIQHFWSLAVEEQFYILWPWVILWLKKPSRLLVFMLGLLTAVIIARLVLWNLQIRDLNYFGLYTFTRIDGICIGSILAILFFKRSRFLEKYFTLVVLGLAGFNFLFYFFNRENDFSLPYLAIIGYTTFAVLFSLLIYEVIKAENKLVNQVLTIRPLRFFGRISYGLYIFHWPVFLIFQDKVLNLLQQQGNFSQVFSQWTTSIILSAAAVLISVISFHGFEKHFLKLKSRYN